MNIEYKVIEHKDFTDAYRKIFAELLEKQNKVQGNLLEKVDRCKEICIAFLKEVPIGIGGIKKKTVSAFSIEKANLMELEKDFDWELGYIFIEKDYEGKGISSNIVKRLLERNENNNLMASTEITKNPAMVAILNKNNFYQKGQSWKSAIHENELGLYLRFV